MLIYGNLCTFMQIRWVCIILKSTKTVHGMSARMGTFSKSVSKRPNLCQNDCCIFWTKTRFCVEMALCRNCLCRSDWHPTVYFSTKQYVTAFCLSHGIMRNTYNPYDVINLRDHSTGFLINFNLKS